MSKLQKLEFHLATRRPIAMEQRCREHRCAEFHDAPEMWSHHHSTAAVYDGFHGSNGSENLLLLVVSKRRCWRAQKMVLQRTVSPQNHAAKKSLGKDVWMRWGRCVSKPQKACDLVEVHDLSTGLEWWSSSWFESLICLHGVGAASSCWHVWVQGRGRPVPAWHWVPGSQSIQIFPADPPKLSNKQTAKSEANHKRPPPFPQNLATLLLAARLSTITSHRPSKPQTRAKTILKHLPAWPSAEPSLPSGILGVALDRLLYPGGGWVCDGGTKCTASWDQKWGKGWGMGGFNGNALVSYSCY